MKPIKYGILWTPSQKVIDLIQFWKDKISSIEPNAIYLKHPVHSTFYLFIADEDREFEIIEKFKSICNSLSLFEIEYDGWGVFNSDKVTKCDTLILKIKLTNEILDCQHKFAKSLVDFKIMDINYPIQWEHDYKKSFDKYGFPFVGKHWLPHISIASVSDKCNEITNEILVSTPVNKFDIFENMSLFKIIDEEHILIKQEKINLQ